MIKKNLIIIPILMFNFCFLYDERDFTIIDEKNTMNRHLTYTKSESEIKIMSVTLVKVLDCGLPFNIAAPLSTIGNDEDPYIGTKNRQITYEKKAVDRCLKSILFLNCPTYPLNTTNAIEEMTLNITTNRIMNCTFETIWFIEFKKPFSGALF